MSSFYEMHAKSLSGEDVSMEAYKGKVVLVVNTASQCGLTPQYKGLEELYKKYGDEGLVVLGFPCNQFGGQEPGDGEQIQNVCLRNYGVTFPVFEKTDVNGEKANPIFVWLKSKLPGWFGASIKWNFTKFLLDREGKPVKRFSPTTKPEALEGAVRRVLGG